MSLSSLPAELQLNIVEHLDPDSNLQFALTCKENATLCGSVLEEHGFRLSEWQVIDTTNGKTLLWEKLKEFIQYPSLGWYIRELNLPSDRQYSWNPAENHAGDGPSNRDKELFARAARQLQNLYPLLEKVHHQDHNYLADSITNPDDLIGTIQERIDGCYEDGVIAILLHYLPNLQTIRITDIKTYALELMLYRIACAYKSPEKSRHLPLKHLKTVSIAHWDSELSCSPDWACYFSSIPTVKTIAAYAMGNSPWDVVAKQLCSQPLSNVTELFLFQCQMDVEGLATILKGIKNLIKFTYTAGGSTVSDMSYDPKRVIKALLEHAAHSLEELVLDQEDFAEDMSDETDLSTISLLGFQKLKLLNCQWKILRPTGEENMEYDDALEEGFFTEEEHKDIDKDWDVRTILPESLEYLYIHGNFPDDDDGIDEWDKMKSVFESPCPSTPNLAWERTCIRRYRQGVVREVIGEAEEPIPMGSRLHAQLFEGHGFF